MIPHTEKPDRRHNFTPEAKKHISQILKRLVNGGKIKNKQEQDLLHTLSLAFDRPLPKTRLSYLLVSKNPRR